MGHQADHPGVIRRDLQAVIAMAETACISGLERCEFRGVGVRLGAVQLEVGIAAGNLLLAVTWRGNANATESDTPKTMDPEMARNLIG